MSNKVVRSQSIAADATGVPPVFLPGAVECDSWSSLAVWPFCRHELTVLVHSKGSDGSPSAQQSLEASHPFQFPR